jgi:hypothetical protein
MKKNMGKVDRIIRIVVSIIFATLYFTGIVTGTWGIILLLLGGVFLLTSFINWCPLYQAFGIGTKKVIEQKS